MPTPKRANRAEQRAARRLMAEHGISYTHALAVVRGESQLPDPPEQQHRGLKVGVVTLSDIAAHGGRLDAGFYLSPEPVKCPGHAFRPCEDNPADPCRNCYEARRTP